MGSTALAVIGDTDLLGGAGVAGEGNDIHQGLVEELLVDISLFDGGADRHLVGSRLKGHTQSKTHTLGNDGTLQEHVTALLKSVTTDHLIRDQVDTLQVAALIGKLCDFLEHILTDLVNNAVKASHM